MIPWTLRSCALVLALLCASVLTAQAQEQENGAAPSDFIGDELKIPADMLIDSFRAILKFSQQVKTEMLGPPAPNESEFLSHMKNVIEESINILEKREYVSIDIFKNHYGDWFTESGGNIVTKIYDYALVKSAYDQLQGGVGDAEQNYQSLAQKFGRDPGEYYRELAATLRPEAVRPPFRIGEVEVETADRTDRVTDASHRLLQARFGLNSSQKLLDEAVAEFDGEETRFWDIFNQEQDRIRPLEQAYRSHMTTLLRAESERLENSSAATAARGGQVERMRRRVEVIGERLALADEVYGGAENARTQKARLAAERDDLLVRLAQADAGPRPRTEDELRAGSRRAKELFDRWDTEKRHSDRVIERAGRDLEMAFDKMKRLQAGVSKAEEELEAAIREWRDAKSDSGLAVAQVSSDDFRASLLPELPDWTRLNRLIAELRSNVNEAELVHEMARREMLSKAASVEAATARLIRSSYASAVTQTGIEAADQIAGFAKTFGKAGPQAAFAEAAATIFWNYASPPTVFDAPSSPFSLTPEDSGWAKKGAMMAGKTAMKAKIDQTVRRGEAAALDSSFAQLRDRSVAEIRRGNFGAAAELSALAEGQRKDLKKLQKEIDVFAFKKGSKELAKALATKIPVDQVKDLVKGKAFDELKEKIALLLEEPAAADYFTAQMQLANAIRKFRMSENMARDLRPHLASLVAERDALLEKYNAEATQLVEKNRQFLAEGGYAFYLYSSDDMKEPSERDAGRKLEARVYLHGVELSEEPSKYGKKYVIRPEDEERFDSTLPEMLTLTIKIQ